MLTADIVFCSQAVDKLIDGAYICFVKDEAHLKLNSSTYEDYDAWKL